MARVNHTALVGRPNRAGVVTPLRVQRSENLIGHGWYVVLLIAFVVACLALLSWVYNAGAEFGHPSRTTTVVATPPTPPTSPTPPTHRPAASRRAPKPKPVAAPATVDLRPVGEGLKSVADAVRDLRETQPTRLAPADEFGQPRQANPCTGLDPAREARCRLWNQQQ